MNYKTLRKSTILAAAVALVVPTAATLAQDSDRNRGQDETGQTVITGQERAEQARQGQQGNQQQQQISQEEAQKISKMFFETQASANQFEIEAAKLAQEKSSNEEVKQLAQMIIEGHEKAQQVLRQEAQKVGAEISENVELKEVHSTTLESLKQREGEDFDRAYVFEQDADHLKTVLLLRHVQNSLPNDAAKAYARQVLPEVERHTQHLDKLASSMSGYDIQWDQGSGAQTAGARVGEAGEQAGQQARDAQQRARQNAQQGQEQNQGQAQVDAEQWFKHAAAANRYLNEAATLASEQSNNPQVTRISQQIQQDHEQAKQRLMQQAEAAGVEIEEEPELLPIYEARLNALREMEGPAFDATYVFDAAAAHRMGLLEYTWASENVNNEQIRSFAQESTRSLEQHQRQIRQAAGTFTGQGGAERSRMPAREGQNPLDRPGSNRNGQ